MPSFSKDSLDKLNTCHPDLVRLMSEVIKRFDFTVIEGHRTLERQKELVAAHASTTMNSKHLTTPSNAVDIAPYPIEWNNIQRFIDLSKVVKQVAVELGIEVEWGGDWHTFKDYPHWQRKV